MRIETAILSNLIHNEEFCRKVVPHLKTEYFSDRKEASIASLLIKFFEQYNKPASPEVLAIEIGNLKGFTDKEIPEMFDNAVNKLLAKMLKYLVIAICGLFIVIILSFTKPLILKSIDNFKSWVETYEVSK